MKASIKKIQDYIDREFPGRDINFYKGAGYFYFCGDNYVAQNIDSIYVPALNRADLEWWISAVDGSIRESIERNEV